MLGATPTLSVPTTPFADASYESPETGERAVTDPTDTQHHEHPFHRTALYQRLHAHPVLSLATKVVVTVIGGAVLVTGVIMLVTPGPAFVMIPLGLAILATEWHWARRLLVRARQAAERAREKAMATDPATRRRRTILGVVVLVLVVAGGVVLTLWFRAAVMG